MQVQYIGGNLAHRGRTGILRWETRTREEYLPHARFPSPQNERVALIQADYPPDTRFDGKGAPIWAPGMTGEPSQEAFAKAHPECFGWHEVNARDWRDVHELPSGVASL